MPSVTSQQLSVLQTHLIRQGLDPALVDELLDHLGCELEGRLAEGAPPDTALQQILLEADAKVIRDMYETYRQELSLTGSHLDSASLDDIVFQFRNKAYGAYDLRRAYRQTLRDAIVTGLIVFVALLTLLRGFSPEAGLLVILLIVVAYWVSDSRLDWLKPV